MTTFHRSIGITLCAAVSMAATAGESTVAIGTAGNSIHITSTGEHSRNHISINGRSIHTGAISSRVTSTGGRSEVHIGAPVVGAKSHREARLCGQGKQSIVIEGQAQSSRIDARNATSLCLSGRENEVIIMGGQTLERISLSGTANRLRITASVAGATLFLGGTNNTIQLPHDSQVKVVDSGSGNRVLRR